jgi:hypothetical protein
MKKVFIFLSFICWFLFASGQTLTSSFQLRKGGTIVTHLNGSGQDTTLKVDGDTARVPGKLASYFWVDSLFNTFSGSSGTVTQVNTGVWATGGPITTTGTVNVDSAAVHTYFDNYYYPLSDNPAGYLTSVTLDSTTISGFHTTNYYNTQYYPLSSNPAGYLTSVGVLDSTTISGFHTTNYYNTIYTPQTRIITINGVSQNLNADRTYNVGTVISSGITAGTGINVSGSPITSSGNIIVTNSAPDQTVVLTEGAGIDVTGTYPNFTIASTFCEPDAFTFTAQTGINVNTLTTSNSVILNGSSDCVWSFVVRGDGIPQVQLNSESWSTSCLARDGDTVTVRLTSAPLGSTEYIATLYTNGLSVPFSVTTASIDADAIAYWTASGITDPDVQGYLHNFYFDWKAAGLYAKTHAMYLLSNGSYASVKFNMVDPDDDNASFRLTENGTITYASSGVTSNGSTGYFNTHFSPNANLTANSAAIGFYSKTNASTGLNGSVTGSNRFVLAPKFGDGIGYSQLTSNAQFASVAVADSRGLFTGSKVSSTDQKLYKNGSSIASNATSDNTTWATDNVYLLVRNNGGTPDNYDTHKYTFVFITDGLSSTEVSDAYTIIQALMTNLGIQE